MFISVTVRESFFNFLSSVFFFCGVNCKVKLFSLFFFIVMSVGGIVYVVVSLAGGFGYFDRSIAWCCRYSFVGLREVVVGFLYLAFIIICF